MCDVTATTAVATWACLDASQFAALPVAAPLMFNANDAQNNTLEYQLSASGCYYQCCSIPLASAVAPASCTPFQPAWMTVNPMSPLRVLAQPAQIATTPIAPVAIASFAPVATAPVTNLTQFALALAIPGQGTSATLPAVPDAATISIFVETATAGGTPRTQAFVVSTTTPANTDWSPTLPPPAYPNLPTPLSIQLAQPDLTKLTTIPFIHCSLSGGTCTFTGRVAIVWTSRTPTLAPGSSFVFTTGIQWLAFAPAAQTLVPLPVRSFSSQLPARTCPLQQTTAGSLTCANNSTTATSHRQQSQFVASPSVQKTTNMDIVLVVIASIIVLVVCGVFIAYVPRFILQRRAVK